MAADEIENKILGKDKDETNFWLCRSLDERCQALHYGRRQYGVGSSRVQENVF
jgi:hypothetical protein